MLDELIAIHREVMATTSTQMKRYLFDKINWSAQAICILGDRGEQVLFEDTAVIFKLKQTTLPKIKGLTDAYLVLNDLEIGFKNKIPLYLFGLLY